jgi:hypothetical protein
VLRTKPGRRTWLQLARGKISINGTVLNAGDGAAATEEEILEIKAVELAEMLRFDLA